MVGIVFLVEKFGVYQQGTYGVFSSQELALSSIMKYCIEETDNYHHFDITEISLDLEMQKESTTFVKTGFTIISGTEVNFYKASC